jgi:hypothetical protein
MEAIVIRGIPVAKLLEVYDAHERAKEHTRLTRGVNDQKYRKAHAAERKAYNLKYHAEKALFLIFENSLALETSRKLAR